ncbi:MAG: response regulator [Methyloceanibacter sp.]
MATKTPCLKPRKAPRLLVVDDDREIRDLLSVLLTRRGYKVVTAREEQAMHQALASSQVDLIILDLMLPGKDGLTIGDSDHHADGAWRADRPDRGP